MATRWGICSAGQIAHDFVGALKILPSSDHQIVAVAARDDLSKAQAFADKLDIPKAYGCYEDLAKDPNVEVVYVSNIDPLHFPSCNLFMDHGKHVLCEKPLTETRDDSQQLINKARDKKLFFMEGLWTRFFPAFQTVRQVLENGELGNVNCVMGAFCVPYPPLDTPRTILQALSCYLTQYAMLVYPDLPDKVMAVRKDGEAGGDTGVSLMLNYQQGGVGLFHMSTRGQRGANTVTFYGSKGNLTVNDELFAPRKVTLPNGEVKSYPLPSTSFQFNLPWGEGFVYEAEGVRKCLKEGLTECPQVTHDDSLYIATVTDEVKRQLGITDD